jgi:hypothetical protein
MPREDPRHQAEPAWWLRQGLINLGGKSDGRSRLWEVAQIGGRKLEWPLSIAFWLVY